VANKDSKSDGLAIKLIDTSPSERAERYRVDYGNYAPRGKEVIFCVGYHSNHYHECFSVSFRDDSRKNGFGFKGGLVREPEFIDLKSDGMLG